MPVCEYRERRGVISEHSDQIPDSFMYRKSSLVYVMLPAPAEYISTKNRMADASIDGRSHSKRFVFLSSCFSTRWTLKYVCLVLTGKVWWVEHYLGAAICPYGKLAPSFASSISCWHSNCWFQCHERNWITKVSSISFLSTPNHFSMKQHFILLQKNPHLSFLCWVLL